METRHHKNKSTSDFFSCTENKGKTQLIPATLIDEFGSIDNYVITAEDKILIVLKADDNNKISFIHDEDKANLCIIDIKTGNKGEKFGKPTDLLKTHLLALNTDNLICSTSNNQIHVWDQEGHLKKKLNGHKDDVGPLLQLDDDKLVSVACYQPEVILWDLKKSEPLWRIHISPTLYNSSLLNLFFSALRYMDVSQELLISIASSLPFSEEDCGKISAITKLNSGDIVCGTDEGIIYLLDAKDGSFKQIFRAYEGNKEKINDSDPTPRKYRFYSSKAITVMQTLPNGDVVAGYYNGTILIWDIQAQTIKQKFGTVSHYNKVNDIKIYKNFIISSSNECQINIWDSNTGKCVKWLGGFKLRYPLQMKENGDLILLINNKVYTLPIQYLLNHPEREISFNEIPYPDIEPSFKRARLN